MNESIYAEARKDTPTRSGASYSAQYSPGVLDPAVAWLAPFDAGGWHVNSFVEKLGRRFRRVRPGTPGFNLAGDRICQTGLNAGREPALERYEIRSVWPRRLHS